MQAVIFSGGKVIKSNLVLDTIKKADLVVAADGGASSALEFGFVPEVVLGDFDSLDKSTVEKLKEKNVKFVVSPTEKDETDTELAIEYAIKKGATEITIIGGTYGDRIDHILANLLYATISKTSIKFVNGQQETFVAKGSVKLSLTGKKSDLLSLIPLQEDVLGLESTGLKWELHNSTLVFGKPRGVSNVFLQNKISLSFTSGTLFITHTYIS